MRKQTLNRILLIIALLIVGALVYNIPIFYSIAGVKYLKKQQPVQAYNLLKKAYLLRPKNKDIRYYYVKAMCELKPTEKIQIEMFNISQKPMLDAAQKLANQKIFEWRYNILNNIGDNYIEQAPYDRNLVRWNVNTFPLKVKIEVPISTPDYYRAEIEKAFTQWTLSTDFLKFEFIEKGNADITVKFNPLPEDICEDGICKYVVAYTNPKIQGKLLKSMTITIYDKDANGNYFSDKEIYNTVLHEIGHALGIMGHSYSSDDLMYMSTQSDTMYTRYRSDFQYISQQDVNTINLLYKMIPEISNVPMSKFNKEGLIYAPIVLGNEKDIGKRKINEALHYIETAPEIPGGYIDLAIAYADMEKYQQAIDSLRKALEIAKTNDDRYLIYFNIAVIYLNTNKLDEAQKYIDLAKTINENDETAEFQSNLNHARAAKKKPFKTEMAD